MKDQPAVSILAASFIAIGLALCIFVFYLDALTLFAPPHSPVPPTGEITIRTAR